MIPIVIPSHLRADKVSTLKFIENPIICVAEKEQGRYKEFNPDTEIVTHPNTVVGLSPKRQWMYEKFKEVFFIDDDLIGVQRVYLPKNHKKPRLTPKELTQWINDLYKIAKKFGINIFGFQTGSYLKFKPQHPIQINKRLDGACMGTLYDDRLYFPNIKNVLMDEWFFLGLNAYYNRKASILDGRLCFMYSDNGTAGGGCGTYRNDESIKMSSIHLKKNFGDSAQMNTTKGNYGYESKLTIPF